MKQRKTILLFMKMLQKEIIPTFSFIGTPEDDGVITIVGKKRDLVNMIKNCFDQTKQGNPNSAQKDVCDIILDVITLCFSPQQIGKIMSARMDTVLKNMSDEE